MPWLSSAARNRAIAACFCSGSRARLSARYQHRSQQAGPAPGRVQSSRMVFYRLSDGFPHPLLEHCLRQLLTIASPEDHDAGA